MSENDVRKGIVNARFNKENSGILALEIVVIAIVAGLVMQSWWWAGGIFFGLFIALLIKPLACFLMILLSLCWGGAGFTLGYLIGSTGAMVVLSLLGFCVGLGAHFSALQYFQDLG
jgi:hypothetical protein